MTSPASLGFPGVKMVRRRGASCPHCADRSSPALSRRIRVLQLLALIEHPDALPAPAALRIAQELPCWLDRDAPRGRSEAVTAEPLAEAMA